MNCGISVYIIYVDNINLREYKSCLIKLRICQNPRDAQMLCKYCVIGDKTCSCSNKYLSYRNYKDILIKLMRTQRIDIFST